MQGRANSYLIRAAKENSIDKVTYALTNKRKSPPGSKGKEEATNQNKAELTKCAEINYIHDPDGEGKAALHYAIEHKNVEMIRILLEEGALPTYPCASNGKTPLYLAAEKEDTAMIELLIQQGANCNETTHKNKATPLHYATKNGNTNLAVVLIQHGANINIPDSRGKSSANYLLHNKAFTTEIITAIIDILLEQKRFEELAYFYKQNKYNLLLIKNRILAHLEKYNNNDPADLATHKELCLCALNKNHPLGELLHTRRKLTACKAPNGTLGKVQNLHSNKIESEILNLKSSHKDPRASYEETFTATQLSEALRTAARSGKDNDIRKYILKDPTVANHRSYERGNALEEALRKGYTDIALLLIQAMNTEALSTSFSKVIQYGNIHVTNELVNRYIEFGDYKRLYEDLATTRAHKPGTFFGKISSGLHLLTAIKSAKNFIADKAKRENNEDFCNQARNRDTYCGKIMHIKRYGTACKDTKGSLKEIPRFTARA